MKTYKHSGTFGDLIYSLPIVKQLGGGKFYLHLDQINWIGQHYYGSTPVSFHQGRMTQKDFLFMRDFMLAQEYITDFDVLDPKTTEITHNLDRFRTLFVGHPGNYVDIYSMTFGIEQHLWSQLRNQPWLTVPEPKKLSGKTIVINRSERWISPETQEDWTRLQEQELVDTTVFVGLAQEHQLFQEFVGFDIDYHPTADLLELAQVIAGCEQFIGNQSLCLSLAIGLGQEFVCELRRDLPQERNECYFPNHPRGQYF